MPRHFQADAGRLAFDDRAEAIQIVRHFAAGKLQVHDLVPAEALQNVLERPVVIDAAMIDDDGPLAEGLHVLHVVTGEEHRDLALGLIELEEVLHAALGHDVQANRRLVQQQHLRAVQEGGDQLHSHSLAQRQFAHRLADELPHFEQARQLVEPALEDGRLDPVDFPVQAERFLRRQIPPELVLLAHHQRKAAAKRVVALPGRVAQHAGFAGTGED